MNKAKLKEICIDAFEEAEKESMERTKQYYVCQVARKMWLALGNPNSSDKAHTNLRDSLFVLIGESFDELINQTKKINNSTYSNLVKQYRKNNLLNQQEFAIQSEISFRTVQNIEDGMPLSNKTKKKLNDILEKQNEKNI